MISGSRRFIRPADGLTVRRHDGTPLPPDGAWVPWCGYYMRRLAVGDVVLATPEADHTIAEVEQRAAEIRAARTDKPRKGKG